MRKATLAYLALTSLITACSSNPDLKPPPAGADGRDGGPGTDTPGGGGLRQTGALRVVTSCGDLTKALQEDALAKMNASIDAQIKQMREIAAAHDGGIDGYYGGGVSGGALGDDSSGDVPVAVPAPAAGVGNAGTSKGGDEASPAHSDTETQVAGVDEADIVKTDGKNVYVLHGDKFLVVDAWPAQALSLTASASIEGFPTEMFVEGKQVVVFSTVDGTSIYAAAGISPRSAYSDGMAYGGVGDIAIAAPSGRAGYGSAYVPNALTKATVLTLGGAGGTTPAVTRELYFEGTYNTSRRVDALVRVVLNGGAHGPSLATYPEQPIRKEKTDPDGTVWTSAPQLDEYVQAWEALRAENTKRIQATTYTDWLPYGFVKTASGVTATPCSCDSFYVPPPGSSTFGVTQLVTFDLDTPDTAPQTTSILGSAETVYANAGAMVLAMSAYVDPGLSIAADANAAKTPISTTFTHLHLFDTRTDPKAAKYVASGTVPGTVLNQFSIDEKNGAVRVATNEYKTYPYFYGYGYGFGGYPVSGAAVSSSGGDPNQTNHLFVLKQGAAPEAGLVVSGDAGAIAPGEQIYSTRFVGDKAYVVTYHVTDPLFVVDVADPNAPKVLGQVQIPGFSNYIHPLDDTHLLTIGRETDDTGHQHTDGGYWYGLALQVFDVTNPLAPKQQWKYVFDGGDYATSEAQDDHKAFTYFDDRHLLAFPYVRQSWYGNKPPSSTLQVFDVTLQNGIKPIGAVDHSKLLGTLASGGYGYCGGYFDGAVRRGVFIENYVYSISYGGILVNDVTTIADPVATLKLDAPVEPSVCKY